MPFPPSKNILRADDAAPGQILLKIKFGPLAEKVGHPFSIATRVKTSQAITGLLFNSRIVKKSQLVEVKQVIIIIETFL